MLISNLPFRLRRRSSITKGRVFSLVIKGREQDLLRRVRALPGDGAENPFLSRNRLPVTQFLANSLRRRHQMLARVSRMP
jgi:hypothetical protein